MRQFKWEANEKIRAGRATTQMESKSEEQSRTSDNSKGKQKGRAEQDERQLKWEAKVKRRAGRVTTQMGSKSEEQSSTYDNSNEKQK